MQRGLLDKLVYALRILGFSADGIDVIKVFHFICSGNFSSFDFNPHLIIFFSIQVSFMYIHLWIYPDLFLFFPTACSFYLARNFDQSLNFFCNLLALVIFHDLLLSQFFLAGEVNCFMVGGKGRTTRAAESTRGSEARADCTRAAHATHHALDIEQNQEN